MRWRTEFLLLLSCWLAAQSRADERIWVHAQINGKPVRFVFDTGASCAVLSREAARRLGLQVSAPQTNAPLARGTVAIGQTEECRVRIYGTESHGNFGVLDFPEYLHTDFDGFLGWPCFNHNIIQIDGDRQKVTFLPRLPRKVTTWTRLALSTNFACLYFELSNKQEKEFVAVDTGDPVGAVLPPAKWRDWKFAHPNQPRTLHAFFMPGSGLVAKEEAWAPEFGFGPVVLTSLPIGEASPSQVALGSPNFGGSLGITALKRCDLIVDGIHAVAYLQPKATRPRANEHNRLGAAFMPADAQSDTLIAQVMQGSPAYEAGMRDGDVLLRIGKMDVSGWRRDPSIKLNNPFRERPAGTKVELALRRGPETYLAKTTLRDILKPESHKR